MKVINRTTNKNLFSALLNRQIIKLKWREKKKNVKVFNERVQKARYNSMVEWPLMLQWILGSTPYDGPNDLFLVPARV